MKKKKWLEEQSDHSSQDQNLYCAWILATFLTPLFIISLSHFYQSKPYASSLKILHNYDVFLSSAFQKFVYKNPCL